MSAAYCCGVVGAGSAPICGPLGPASGQTYPNRAITLVVPLPHPRYHRFRRAGDCRRSAVIRKGDKSAARRRH
jgi:hypothetical protein